MAAEVDALQVRPPESITITVLRARYLRGSKADAVNTILKAEFGDKLLGESQKQECTPDIPSEFNFSVSLPCNTDDPLSLDELVHRPVVVSVLEVLAKEKKTQKEERTNILGQCCLDLLPLFQGNLEVLQHVPIYPVTDSVLELAPSVQQQPEIEVKLSVNQPLQSEAQLRDNNLLTISVGSLYSPPESWSLSSAPFNYVLTTPLPVTGEKELPVMFMNGKLKQAQDKEGPKRQKKWAVPGTAAGNATLLPDSFFSLETEEEDGDLKTKADLENRKIAETEKNRITWNMERRFFLAPSAAKSFQDTISKSQFWPLEVLRVPLSTGGGKGKKEKHDEDGTISFHGLILMNLSSLLYPGVTSIKGAYRVVGYSESALYDKTKRKAGVCDEIGMSASAWLSKVNKSASVLKFNPDKEKKDQKKLSSSKQQLINLKSENNLESEAQTQAMQEGQQYSDAKSYVMIDFCLKKPLIPKRTTEALVKKIAELAPPRPLYPQRTDRAQKVVEEYHTQIASVAGVVLDEFRDLFSEELEEAGPQKPEVMEERRQQLIYELNSSGKYFAIKEQLKHSVVKIVREKYLRTTNFDSKEELQAFLSELYVYLVDQMHVSLGKVLALEDQPPIPQPLTDSSQLQHFALEAEMNQNYTLAAYYYKERIARYSNVADCWLDFGIFNLFMNDVTKAEECCKECLAINQKHLDGLLMYGIVCIIAEKIETAETFFETATCLHPNSVLAWTMLGLFYDGVSNEIGAEMAYAEANKLQLSRALVLAEAAKAEQKKREEEERKERERNAPDVEPLDSAELPSINTNGFGPSAANSEVKTIAPDKSLSKGKPSRKILVDSTSPSGSLSKSTHIKIAPAPEVLAATGQVKAAEAPESSPGTDSQTDESPPLPTSSIFLDAVEWLLNVKSVTLAERALGHELLRPEGPNIDFHVAMTKLCLLKEAYQEAEASISEAIQMDIQNQDAWALLGHVKYLIGDHQAAQHCYERTLAFVTDASDTHPVYIRLASIYLQEKRYQDAKNIFLMACRKSPSCVSWLGVGIACYRLGELGEAEDALSEANILNNRDPEVWAYLSLVCLKTSRCLQAEQAYKYAMKLNLEEGPLLAEIHTEQARLGFGNPGF